MLVVRKKSRACSIQGLADRETLDKIFAFQIPNFHEPSSTTGHQVSTIWSKSDRQKLFSAGSWCYGKPT